MMIDLSRVLPNPYRDFDLDPINPAQVEALRNSIGPKDSDDPKHLGFWGGICVRKTGDGEFELVFGHHRLAALRAAGWTKADLNIIHYDDLQMARGMANENSLQRRGQAATQDAVAAAVRVLGYHLLKGDENLGKFLPGLAERGFDTARGMLLKGEGLGRGVLEAFFGDTISRGDIAAAISGLKKNGKMTQYLNEIHARVEADRIALEERQAAAKRKIDQDRLAAQIEAAEKVEAEAAAAADAQAAKAVTLSPKLAALFPITSVYKKVADVLSSDRGLEYVAVEQQERVALGLLGAKAKQDPALEKAWKAWIKSDRTSPMPEVDLTAKEAGEMLNAYFSNGRRWLDKITAPAPEQKKADDAAEAWSELQQCVGWISDEAIRLTRALKEGAPLPCSAYELASFVRKAKKEITNDLDALLKAARAEDADKVVSVQ